jgi:hypothetical protein
VTLARGDDFTFATRHPKPAEIGMLIEVADSTLTRDRQDKGRIHARAQLPIYWIVNLVDRQIEVYTNPINGGEPATYGQRADFRLGESVPLVLDGVTVAHIGVTDILA